MTDLQRSQLNAVASSVVCKLVLLTLAGILLTAATLPAAAIDATGPKHDQCYTQVIWEEKYGSLKDGGSACTILGDCDISSVRDAYIPDSTDPIMVLQLYFHVFRNDDGSDPAADEQDVADAVEDANGHYLPLRVQFEYEMRFVNSSQFRYLTSDAEFNQMKAQYAIAPDSQLNIYVASVNVNGSVFSFGTFPWDPDALDVYGGIVMNRTQFPPYNSRTLTHEIGHNLGLWHTHHGVSEVSTCGPCYEFAGAPADDRGDFCSDTDPTPTNYGCGPPGGSDPCTFEPWGPTHPENHMGYGGCRNTFSVQQWGRMHCWTDDVLTSWQINVQIFADTVFGPAPLNVNFTGVTPKTVLTWDWDFGDGNGSGLQNPSNMYVDGGQYDVTVEIEALDGIYQTARADYISVYADTMVVAYVTGSAGQQVQVDVYANNKLPVRDIIVPVSYAGPFDLKLDSASVVGLRTEYAYSFSKVASDANNKLAAYRILTTLDGSQPLPPDTGSIMRLFFTISNSPGPGPSPIEITSFGAYSPYFAADAGNYTPELVAGSVDFCRVGDVNNNGSGPDIEDVTYLVDYLFKGGPPPPIMEYADIDGSGGIPNVADLSYTIDYLFKGGPPPVCP